MGTFGNTKNFLKAIEQAYLPLACYTEMLFKVKCGASGSRFLSIPRQINFLGLGGSLTAKKKKKLLKTFSSQAS